MCRNPDGAVDPAEGRVLPGEAALQRLQRHDQQQHQHTETLVPQKKPCSVPKLVTMATQAAISLTSGEKRYNRHYRRLFYLYHVLKYTAVTVLFFRLSLSSLHAVCQQLFMLDPRAGWAFVGSNDLRSPAEPSDSSVLHWLLA